MILDEIAATQVIGLNLLSSLFFYIKQNGFMFYE
jgi:hypothetical protein